MFQNVAGSSPWARGTLNIREIAIISKRFIPVGTGNTHDMQFVGMLTSVHPRGHGEHLKRQT